MQQLQLPFGIFGVDLMIYLKLHLCFEPLKKSVHKKLASYHYQQIHYNVIEVEHSLNIYLLEVST